MMKTVFFVLLVVCLALHVADGKKKKWYPGMGPCTNEFYGCGGSGLYRGGLYGGGLGNGGLLGGGLLSGGLLGGGLLNGGGYGYNLGGLGMRGY